MKKTISFLFSTLLLCFLFTSCSEPLIRGVDWEMTQKEVQKIEWKQQKDTENTAYKDQLVYQNTTVYDSPSFTSYFFEEDKLNKIVCVFADASRTNYDSLLQKLQKKHGVPTSSPDSYGLVLEWTEKETHITLTFIKDQPNISDSLALVYTHISPAIKS